MYNNRGWINRMLSTPGASAIRKFDIANVHLRGRARDLPSVVRGWRAFFAKWGFRGPLWVTEHGYPAIRAFQYDPAYPRRREASRPLPERSLPALRRAGAAQVFVTQRDSWPDEFGRGEFASEGILNLGQRAALRSPAQAAFDTVSAITRRWRTARRLKALRPRTCAKPGVSSGLTSPARPTPPASSRGATRCGCGHWTSTSAAAAARAAGPRGRRETNRPNRGSRPRGAPATRRDASSASSATCTGRRRSTRSARRREQVRRNRGHGGRGLVLEAVGHTQHPGGRHLDRDQAGVGGVHQRQPDVMARSTSA